MRKLLLFLGFFCLIVFFIFYYKTYKNGNNISNKSQEEIIDYILNNMNEYNANMEVTVISNKNENVYEINQNVTKNKSTQEIIKPENIKGIKIELEEKKLKIYNPKLDLEKSYENYETIANNSMFLNVFVKEFLSNESKKYEEENQIILETKIENNKNTYAKYKQLYINKETNKIEKLIIKDTAKKVRVSIKYNDIEIK